MGGQASTAHRAVAQKPGRASRLGRKVHGTSAGALLRRMIDAVMHMLLTYFTAKK